MTKTDFLKFFRKEEGGKNQWWLIIILVAVFLILAFLSIGFAAFELKYQDRLYPGTKIGYLGFAGLTADEAGFSLQGITEEIEKEGVRIIYRNGQEKTINISPTIEGLADPDLTRQIINFNNGKTVEKLFAFGRDGNFLQNLANQIKIIFRPQKFEAEVDIDDAGLKNLIAKEFGTLNQPAKNARPAITWQDSAYQITIIPEEAGQIINADKAINELKENLKNLSNSTIEIKKEIESPLVSYQEASQKKYLVDQILATSSPKLIFADQTWTLSKKELADMLEFKKNENGQIFVGPNFELFQSWLEKKAEPIINATPQNAKIEMADNRITKITAHQNGREIDYEKTLLSFEAAVLAGQEKSEIQVKITPPEITTESINSLGISEIIGTGKSSFAGSPTNRRHNIRTGANKLHGVLLKPGDEFSLVKTLGPVEANTGYLPELVIKDNKTTPEYGGGLCQIGTTIFRAAMASGLPILERQNHSYSVTYYLENGLPGTDATIYIPKPDFRFLNDTGNYLLIQSRIEGDMLYFDVWGKADGRKAQRTTPKVWGWTSPAPTKYVETLSLKPGQKKCTESSHKGVSASFDYQVTYPNGEIKKTTFSSRYKPWQAVCLIGVEKLTTEQSAATSTSPLISPDIAN